MRKLVVALAVGAFSVGVVPPAVAEPAPESCNGAVVSSSVTDPELGPGRRSVATEFFGDEPTAVRDAEQALMAFCAVA